MCGHAAELFTRLPEAKRYQAETAFNEFKLAWNTIMPTIEMLFQCNENPYVHCIPFPLPRTSYIVTRTPCTQLHVMGIVSWETCDRCGVLSFVRFI